MALYDLGRVSVDGVIRLEEHLPPRDIERVVTEAMAVRLAEITVRAVGQDLPPFGQDAIRWVVENAQCRTQVEDLSTGLGVSRGTLSRELAGMDLVPGRTLLLWGRLLQASHWLERPGETVESVAFHLGYGTAGALGKALKHHVGCSPTELVRRGGLAWTLDAFRRKGVRRDRGSRKRWTHARSLRWRTPSASPGGR
jgi:AraC-like DNA-binding protein